LVDDADLAGDDSFTADNREVKGNETRPLFWAATHHRYIRQGRDPMSRAKKSESRCQPKPRVQTVYQFKITLHNGQPTIWRRTQVHDCALA
jgi:hypothetical protein